MPSWEDKIKSNYSYLRPSEQKVADFILTHQGSIAKLTLVDVAKQAMVSQPTVIRFVQAMGFDGYRNFKYALMREECIKEEPASMFNHLGSFDLKPWDTIEELPVKEVKVVSGLLEEALKALSLKHLKRAIAALTDATHVEIYCVENSVTPASDLLNKLLYLGINASLHTDAYLQQISASHLGKKDVAVAFSHSGCSIDTVKALKYAKKAGARTIAITSQKVSQIVRYADILLCYALSENTIYGSAIFSRIPDLAVVDLIYMGIILSDYEHFSKKLDQSGNVIADRGDPSGHCIR